MFDPKAGDFVRRTAEFRKSFEGEASDEIGIVASRYQLNLEDRVEDRLRVRWPDGNVLNSFVWHFEAA